MESSSPTYLEKACQNRSELFDSEPFKRVLKIYNRLNDKKYTVNDLNSFDKAAEVMAFWEESIAVGKVAVVEGVQKLVRSEFEKTRANDKERVLFEQEMVSRFKEIGVDMSHIHTVWEEFYQYSEDNNEPLQLPLVSESEMQAFEKCLGPEANLDPELRTYQVMIDDTSVTPKEEFERGEELIKDALPLDLTSPLMKLVSFNEKNGQYKVPKTLMGRLYGDTQDEEEGKEQPGKTRMVVYTQSGTRVFSDNAGRGAFFDGVKQHPHVKIMELGTLMRLCKKLESDGEKAITDFSVNDEASQGKLQLNTITNAVSPDGKVVVVTYDPVAKKFSAKLAAPGKREYASVIRQTVESDLR